MSRELPVFGGETPRTPCARALVRCGAEEKTGEVLGSAVPGGARGLVGSACRYPGVHAISTPTTGHMSRGASPGGVGFHSTPTLPSTMERTRARDDVLHGNA
ncbi:hypothetical protein GCM10022402_17330 [Salinactinospora qingdaonensis]|uniref:Uncharacterized protein n=1 Tax=Salinactinospora qingdaonensis TaxID=702744 RepID=A0ABP7FGG9_9ACTN